MTYGMSQYQNQSGTYLPPRHVEAMAFRHVNDLLSKAKTHSDRQSALSANLKLWGILMQGIQRTDCPLDEILRKDLTTVGTWSMRYANVALNSDTSLKALIDINEDMIEGLSASPPATATPYATSAASSDARMAIQMVG
ncbi:flagellin assembly protein [Gluconobacter oxydans]|uniref:flagellar biosynthesis regulator FlaF n=1 Tax=Gluconobacter thailandicus TaxID=257438 RepID=UPI0002998C36|nr:flagellar biosynthesis regulator FlaF [Gluconobacter thailandicus]AFW00979.1 flagellin assembly protein [Gluconobacter oxydans H24]ANQ40366.1 flagellin assembly protein [Gluconobacter oxydans]